jgi:hypothetical protein
MTTKPRATDSNSGKATIRDSLLVLLQLHLSNTESKKRDDLTVKIRAMLKAVLPVRTNTDQLGLLLNLLDSDYEPLNLLLMSADIRQVIAAATNIDPQNIRNESVVQAIDICYRALNLECSMRGIRVQYYKPYKERAENSLCEGRKAGAAAIHQQAVARREILREEAIAIFYENPSYQYKSVVPALAAKHRLGEPTVRRHISGTKAEALAMLEQE